DGRSGDAHKEVVGRSGRVYEETRRRLVVGQRTERRRGEGGRVQVDQLGVVDLRVIRGIRRQRVLGDRLRGQDGLGADAGNVVRLRVDCRIAAEVVAAAAVGLDGPDPEFLVRAGSGPV